MGLFLLNLIDKYPHFDIRSFLQAKMYMLLLYDLKTQITRPLVVSGESFMWNYNGDSQILIRKFSMINRFKKDLTLKGGAQ